MTLPIIGTLSWSIILVLVVNALYAGVMISHIANGRWGLAMAFAGYTLANFGLIVAEKAQ